MREYFFFLPVSWRQVNEVIGSQMVCGYRGKGGISSSESESRLQSTVVQNKEKNHLIIHFLTSKGVSKVSKQGTE